MRETPERQSHVIRSGRMSFTRYSLLHYASLTLHSPGFLSVLRPLPATRRSRGRSRSADECIEGAESGRRDKERVMSEKDER